MTDGCVCHCDACMPFTNVSLPRAEIRSHPSPCCLAQWWTTCYYATVPQQQRRHQPLRAETRPSLRCHAPANKTKEMHVPPCHYVKATSSLSTLIIFLFLIISVHLSHSSNLTQFFAAFPFLKYLCMVPRNLSLTLTTKPNLWFSFKSSEK